MLFADGYYAILIAGKAGNLHSRKINWFLSSPAHDQSLLNLTVLFLAFSVLFYLIVPLSTITMSKQRNLLPGFSNEYVSMRLSR